MTFPFALRLIAPLAAAVLVSAPALGAVTVGQAAPAFALSDQNGKTRSAEEFKGKWLVLYFYPKADTPSCTDQACGFRDEFALLKVLGAEVMGVSTDNAADLTQFAQKNHLPFPLLADKDGKVSELFGTLINLGLTKLSKRHTFLIDPDGKIVRRYTDVNAKGDAKQVVEDLRQLTKASKP